MYIQTIYNSRVDGSRKPSVFIFKSYRENGKQKREVVANLSKLPSDIIEALKQFLENKKSGDIGFSQSVTYSQGKSFGAFWVFLHLAKQIGLWDILGRDRNGKLAMLQIIARIISQSSRLHISSFYPEHYALKEVLKIDFAWDENDLYDNLNWLEANQTAIEDKLFLKRDLLTGEKPDTIYLYDVTSSYLEGTKNELAKFGYNRDKKKGKKQIVIGLLCDVYGYPISIEVFSGNTSDTQTVESQIKKLSDRFGLKRVVFVGDKGMIKSQQTQMLNDQNWNYITSITKEQINTLLKENVIDMTLFCDDLMEVSVEQCTNDKDEQGVEKEQHRTIRYIMRRNGHRALEIKRNRAEKIERIQTLITQSNQYLAGHPKAKPETQLKNIGITLKKFKIHSFINITENERIITMNENPEIKAEAEKLDGCYVVKTDVNQEFASKEIIHQRYKELAKVETAFRTMKTGLEEIRPLYLRKAERTKGHAFVCMLAYLLVKKFDQMTNQIQLTLKERIESINMMQYLNCEIEGVLINKILTNYNSTQTAIMDALNIKLPNRL